MTIPRIVATMTALNLTREQKRAAACSEERAYIEAAPGSGKTTIAAERYGVVRYRTPRDARRVLALSFARSARSELEQRIRERWGGTALRWPNAASTLDTLHHRLVARLLRNHDIHWLGGREELVVLDTWRGQAGARPLLPEYMYCRVARLDGRTVATTGRRIGRLTYGFGNKQPHEEMLAAGICTHEEIRQVLHDALQDPDLRALIADHLRATTKAVIVDEVFDGNALDLEIVKLAAEAGIPTTVVGDPWQALYEFRGAEPNLVPGFIAALGFETFPVTESFRFATDEMKTLAEQLRGGQPVALTRGTPTDSEVVLASWWRHLWEVSDDVLPLAFGQIQNRTDAALALLLEPIAAGHFGPIARASPEAAVALNLTPEQLRTDVAAAVMPVLDRIASGTTADAVAGLRLLRASFRDLGGCNIPSLASDNEAERVASLVALSKRLSKTRLVPGLSVHQAKGREWRAVVVYLRPGQHDRLATGLDIQRAGDREIYVALTRARDAVRTL